MPMTRRKKQAADRHLHRKMFRVDDDLHAMFLQLAKKRDRPIAYEVRRALREHLRRAGMLPKPEEDTDGGDA